jgi:hypothetical protein
MASDPPTVQILADRDMLRAILDAVNFRLEKWPGGEPSEQEMLIGLQRLLFAASLELMLKE